MKNILPANEWPVENLNACSKLCRAFDWFAFSSSEDENVKLDCICWNEYDIAKTYNGTEYNFNKAWVDGLGMPTYDGTEQEF